MFVSRQFDHNSASLRADLDNQQDLDAAIAGMQRSGVPLVGQLVIEYAGEGSRSSVWQRFAAYRDRNR